MCFTNKNEGEEHEKKKTSWGVVIDYYACFEPDILSGVYGSGERDYNCAGGSSAGRHLICLV